MLSWYEVNVNSPVLLNLASTGGVILAMIPTGPNGLWTQFCYLEV